MKEGVHQGLAALVIQRGASHIAKRHAKKIIYASIEPDLLNKQQIEENILHSPKILYKWWVNHTLFASSLAVAYISEAKEAYRSRKSVWSRYLGYAFHFITDRATPFHSPGKIAHILSSLMEESDEKDILRDLNPKNRVIFEVLNMGAKFVSKAIGLKCDHDNFEDLCEKKWGISSARTSEFFIRQKKSNKFSTSLRYIEKEVDRLHEEYKNITSDWIKRGFNYERYMADIASVMDLASQYVVHN